jgi:hypothetical protein
MRRGGRQRREGLLTGGLLGAPQRMGESSSGGGLGARGGAIGPQILVQGVKKLLQDVSGDALNKSSVFPYHANVLTGRALSHDCTKAYGGPNGGRNGAPGVSRTRSSLTAPTVIILVNIGKANVVTRRCGSSIERPPDIIRMCIQWQFIV